MLSRLSHTRLLRSAGLYTWALVGIPIVGNAWFLPPSSGVDDQGINVPMALLAYLVFGVSYWLATRSLASSRPASPAWDIPLLVLLTSAAVAVGLFTKTGLGALLMLIVAGVLPWLLSARVAVAWLVVAHVFLVPSFMALGIFNFWEAVFQASFYVGFAVFVLVTAYVARQQAAAREEQRRLNAELRATRLLLGMVLVAGLVWALTVFAPYVFMPETARPSGPDDHFGPGFVRQVNQYIAGTVFISLSVGGLVGWLFRGAKRDG